MLRAPKGHNGRDGISEGKKYKPQEALRGQPRTPSHLTSLQRGHILKHDFLKLYLGRERGGGEGKADKTKEVKKGHEEEKGGAATVHFLRAFQKWSFNTFYGQVPK